MTNLTEILDNYKDLCKAYNKKLSREEYRSVSTKFSSSLIEKIWGNWTTFVKNIEEDLLLNRHEIIKKVDKSKNKVVISYIPDGSEINIEVFYTLLNYCEKTNSELYLLWGKSVKKRKSFDLATYKLLQPYLTTEIVFEKDKFCLGKDFLIPFKQKNPLINLDKLTTDLTTIIVGSTKQYMRILPYKQYNDYRVAYSTGTIAEIEYGQTVSEQLDANNHTFGGILLEYDSNKKRYVSRNLIYKNGFIYDLNKRYTQDSEQTLDNVEGLVLGDLHLPEEDIEALEKTSKQLKFLSPKEVIIHDVASWNSISHHEFNLPFTRVKNKTEETLSLSTELDEVVKRLTAFSQKFPDINFKIVNSNHDDFIRKFLEKDFINDTINAEIGAQLFIKYLKGKTILSDLLPDNVAQLPKNTSYKIADFEINEHGDCGISGAHGSINSFNKSFYKLIHGHTHSPEIFEKVVVVGTLSKLKLNYNQQGLTKWVHSNCIIHKNGSFQLILL